MATSLGTMGTGLGPMETGLGTMETGLDTLETVLDTRKRLDTLETGLDTLETGLDTRKLVRAPGKLHSIGGGTWSQGLKWSKMIQNCLPALSRPPQTRLTPHS
jgi:hypothetical protein